MWAISEGSGKTWMLRDPEVISTLFLWAGPDKLCGWVTLTKHHYHIRGEEYIRGGEIG